MESVPGEGSGAEVAEFPDGFTFSVPSADPSFNWEALGDVDDFVSLGDIFDAFGDEFTR